nr:Putative AC9 transposase [Ipomoea batatas]
MKVKAVKLNPFLLVSSKVEPYFQISFQHQVINSSSTCDLQLLFYIQVHYQPWISPATIPHKLLNPFLKARRTYANLAKLLEEESLSNTSDFDIIAWWKCVGSRYPLFQKMAKDILAIPISSVALESVFSIGGRLFEILIDYGSDATVDDYSSDAYYYDSADPPSCESEEDVEREPISTHKKFRFPSYNPECEYPDLERGLLFEDATQFKSAMVKYAVHHKRDIHFYKNERNRVRVKCKWIEEKYEDKIIRDPTIKHTKLKDDIEAELKINVNVAMVRRAHKGLEENESGFSDQFKE